MSLTHTDSSQKKKNIEKEFRKHITTHTKDLNGKNYTINN